MDAGKPWPIGKALLLWPLIPATAARRIEPVSLRLAYEIHVLVCLLTVWLAILLAGWSRDIQEGGRLGLWRSTWVLIQGRAPEGRLQTYTVILAGTAAFIEGLFLATALLATPWGATDEPMRSSVGRAVRRTWLHTVCGLPAVLLIGLLINGLSLADRAWQRRVASPPAYPLSLWGPAATTQAQKDYQAAWDRYYAEYQRWDQRRPWYLRDSYRYTMIPCFIIGVLAWFVLALLRSVGADRPVKPPDRPPMCETCGYDLRAAPMDGRCPECGEPVADSLGKDARPGTPWQRRRDIGRLLAWRESASDAILQPRRFGRQIQLYSSPRDHRLFLWVHPLAIFLIGAVAGVYLWGARWWAEAPAIGCLFTVLACLFTLSASWLAALYYRLTEGRNLLSATVRVTSYLAPYLVIWACFAVVFWTYTDAPMQRFLDFLGSYLGKDTTSMRLLACLGVNLVGLAIYLRLVFWCTSTCRYANR